jgi:exonuclease VII large subunit
MAPVITPVDLQPYLDDVQAQQEAYYQSRLDQFDLYQDEIEKQQEVYVESRMEQFSQYQDDIQQQMSDFLETQRDQYSRYADDTQQQFREYADQNAAYGDALANWQKNRQKAISSAEKMLGSMHENYGRSFYGHITSRWYVLLANMAGLLALVLFFQKRKDVI